MSTSLKERLIAVDLALTILNSLSYSALENASKALKGEESPVGDKTKLTSAVKDVNEACLRFIALEHPMCQDLRFALAALRIGQDFERLTELSQVLQERASRLKDLTKTDHVAQDVMSSIWMAATSAEGYHALTSQCHVGMKTEAWAIVEKAAKTNSELLEILIQNAQANVLEAMTVAEIPPMAKIEMTLACRHIKRIVHLTSDIVGEWRVLRHPEELPSE